MSSISNTKSNQPEIPPRARAVLRPLAVLFLLILAFGATTSLEAANQHREEPIRLFRLQAGLSGHVDPEGGLIFLPAGSRIPLLRTELISLTDSRRRRSADTFHAVVVDGAAGGQRGFSARADDDQDGRTDEDPLDGIDNDQDGNIDEDFAAISDAMVVVHLGEPGTERRGLHLEYYHWATPRLSSAVFLNAGGGPKPTGQGTYRINSSGPAWHETRISSLRHTAAGRPEQEEGVAFVCQVSLDSRSIDHDPCMPGSSLWLGVMILDEDSLARFILDQDQLDLTLDESPVPLVICAAESWMQLNRILGEARSVYEGMTDPVDSRRARWIIPPSCSVCRTASHPGFNLKTDTDGDFTLVANISSGQCGLLDPDLFQVENRPLGAPREIRWLPTGGKESSVTWGCLIADRLQNGFPVAPVFCSSFFGLYDHQARGRLEFIFNPPPDILENSTSGDPKAATEVVGRYIDGRTLRTPLTTGTPEEPEIHEDRASSPDPTPETVVEATRRYTEDRTRILKSGRHQPCLSPDLLMGWPNPFNDVTSIRFTIPRTMKEAFIWKNDEEQPAVIDLEGDVPWSGGQPTVSVKIYSISGQELVTLHSANQGVGEYTVQWNGTDAFGRKVASGTYFCKLQMDDWSVTRRLVFIR